MNADEKTKILLIDDEPTTTHIIKSKLEEKGRFAVTALNDPTRAMEAIEEIAPHIIITDVLMPNLDGKKLVEIIRSSKFSRIPIIVLSARKKMEDYFKAVHFVDFVEKTETGRMIAKLEHAIDNILEGAVPEKKKAWDSGEILTRLLAELEKYDPASKDKAPAKPGDLLDQMKKIIAEYEPVAASEEAPH